MKRVLVSATVALAVGAAVPAVATAHDAVVSCDNGNLVVVPDYLHETPTWSIVGSDVVVTWSDGFTRTIPLPPACEARPEPAPVPEGEEIPVPPVVVVPPPVAPPPTCAELLARYPKAGPVRRANWGCPTSRVKLPPKPDKLKRKVVRRYFPCRKVGNRAKEVIIVTLPSGKVGKVTRWGKRCKIPAVAG